MENISVIDMAYTAGLLDGEGSIVIGVSQPNEKRGNKSPSHWLQVGIINTNREVIDWLHTKFGGHISDNSHSPSRRKQKPCWAWRVVANEAKRFLKCIYPFLIIKKKQAQLAIEFQKEREGLTTKQLTPEVIIKREFYRNELRKLTL